MASPAVVNRTPFAFEPLFLSDVEGQPVMVALVKATLAIGDQGRLTVAEKQVPVNLAGELWGKPGRSSYKYEPETAPVKLSTDVVFIADAYPQHYRDTDVDVELRVGALRKYARVFGSRHWIKSFGSLTQSPPQPLDVTPLTYEHAYGGHDPTSAEDQPLFDRRNPVGIGYHANSLLHDLLPLPHIEDPANLIQRYEDRPEPTGFGFLSPDWLPRAALAGTYDSRWLANRMPLLPKDFDPRFFNAASPGLVSQAFLDGHELVSVKNATPDGLLSLTLPGIAAPSCLIEVENSRRHELRLQFDTLIVNVRERLIFLLWRSALPLRNGPHDVTSVHVCGDRLPEPGGYF